MKLLMLIYSGPSPDRIVALLERHHVAGYTEIDDVHGAGATGRMAGDRAWPGSSTIFASAVPAERLPELRSALTTYKHDAAEGEHLHVAVLPIEDYF